MICRGEYNAEGGAGSWHKGGFVISVLVILDTPFHLKNNYDI